MGAKTVMVAEVNMSVLELRAVSAFGRIRYPLEIIGANSSGLACFCMVLVVQIFLGLESPDR